MKITPLVNRPWRETLENMCERMDAQLKAYRKIALRGWQYRKELITMRKENSRLTDDNIALNNRIGYQNDRIEELEARKDVPQAPLFCRSGSLSYYSTLCCHR